MKRKAHPLIEFVKNNRLRKEDLEPYEYQYLKGYIDPVPADKKEEKKEDDEQNDQDYYD